MSENDEASALEGWGLVPKPVVEAVHALNKKILRSGQHLDGLVWPDKPRDVQDLLRMSVSDAHKSRAQARTYGPCSRPTRTAFTNHVL